MRKDDRTIWNTSAEILRQTYLNGQYTNEYEEIEDLGFPSAHPTGRERGFASNLPSVIRAKAMFKKRLENRNE